MVSKSLQEGSDSYWDDGSVSLVGDELDLQQQSAPDVLDPSPPKRARVSCPDECLQ